jgi:hypothetical protein
LPPLKVLSLHGPERKSRFAEIPEHDVVLTTYPLLWRDADELMQHSYHCSSSTRRKRSRMPPKPGAEAVRKVDARHRLCLTGTPLENHLGENCGASSTSCCPAFSAPASNSPNTGGRRSKSSATANAANCWPAAFARSSCAARRKTSRRSCRRRPSSCAASNSKAPARSLRNRAQPRWTPRYATKSPAAAFARSQIVILDALLKLRQVCCDPRLVKAAAAARSRNAPSSTC